MRDRGETPREPHEPQGLEGSPEAETSTEALSTTDEVTTEDDEEAGGGLLGRRTVVPPTETSASVTTTEGAEVSAGPATFCARSSRTFPGAVTTTVAVLPSGAMLTDVLVIADWSASTSPFGGPASGLPPPVASMEARVAQTVATSTPPAASSTTEETFFSGGAGDSE